VIERKDRGQESSRVALEGAFKAGSIGECPAQDEAALDLACAEINEKGIRDQRSDSSRPGGCVLRWESWLGGNRRSSWPPFWHLRNMLR